MGSYDVLIQWASLWHPCLTRQDVTPLSCAAPGDGRLHPETAALWPCLHMILATVKLDHAPYSQRLPLKPAAQRHSKPRPLFGVMHSPLFLQVLGLRQDRACPRTAMPSSTKMKLAMCIMSQGVGVVADVRAGGERERETMRESDGFVQLSGLGR